MHGPRCAALALLSMRLHTATMTGLGEVLMCAARQDVAISQETAVASASAVDS